jgi:hypothetical protein
LFRAGKGCKGYFNNKNIQEEAANLMQILSKEYPDKNHVLIFNNAWTHLKHTEGSQSALYITKGPSANFMVEVNNVGEDGQLKYTQDGKILKKKIPMSNGRFADETE